MRIEVDEKILWELYRVALGWQLSHEGGIAGQAFTEYTCLKCEKEHINPDTNTPQFCRKCTKDIRTKFSKEVTES